MMKEINLGEPNTLLEERRLKVELDKKALYALASDTRMEILKALQNDRRTVSQLAEHLAADKAGVHRHLKKLEEGGFVSRDEDHGFVYYTLTWKARDLISPGENTKIIILISSTFLVLLVIGLILLASPSMYDQGDTEKAADSNQAGNDGIFSSDDAGGHSGMSMITVSLLAFLAVVLVFVAYRKLRRPIQSGAQRAESFEPEIMRDLD